MMIKPQIVLIIIMLPIFMGTTADATPITGRTIKTWIDESKPLDQKDSSKQSVQSGKLQGYLTGLSEAMVLTKLYCPPEGLLLKDLLLLVDKHLEYDYANRDTPATPRLMQLFRQTFPCPSGIKKTPRPKLNPHPNKEQST